jgi:hypothetical protein
MSVGQGDGLLYYIVLEQACSENINEMNLKLEAREEERDINRGMRSGIVT